MSGALSIGNGYKLWRNETRQPHREDGPAVEMANGNKLWYLYGKRHRTDGPAVEHANVYYKEWYLHGKRHRTDGPAVEFENGDKAWYIHGKRHRTDGPAIEFANGDKVWFLHGKETTQWEFTNLLVQHHLKLQLVSRVIPPGAESLVHQYVM
jgi:hypothetical protein